MIFALIVLLSLSELKCLFSNEESSMVRPTLIDMNPSEPKYYQFMISFKKCTRGYNVLSPKTCVKAVNTL